MPPPSRSKDMFMPITNREPVRLAKLPDGHLREKNLYVGSEEKASSSSGSIASDHQCMILIHSSSFQLNYCSSLVYSSVLV